MDKSVTLARGWTLMDAEEWRDDVKIGFGMLRTRLFEGYEARAWELLGYANWRECVVAEFGQSERHLYRQLEAAEIERRVLTHGSIEPVPERQLRPLAKLTPMEQKPAWEEAVASAPNGKVTAAHVAAVVDRRLHDPEPPPPPPAPEPEPALELAPEAIADELANEAYQAEEEDECPGELSVEPLAELPRPEPAMAVHFSSASSEWYTPRDIVDRVVTVLGAIDLDPCSNTGTPNVPAAEHYTEAKDGLSRDWHGRVYMNPPYGRGIDPWIGHLVEQYQQGFVTEAIALVPARVDTTWFRRFRDFHKCFIDGRLKFSGHENSAPFPSAVIYLGKDPPKFIAAFEDLGDVYARVSIKGDGP